MTLYQLIICPCGKHWGMVDVDSIKASKQYGYSYEWQCQKCGKFFKYEDRKKVIKIGYKN